MTTSIFIYSAATFAIGLFLGLIVQMAVDNSYLGKLEQENDTLRMKLEDERKKRPVETIEIIDDTIGRDIDYSQRW